MSSSANGIDIHQPETWDEIVGNHRLKEYLFNLIRAVRIKRQKRNLNSLVTGAPRSGKTISISQTLQSIACLNLDFDTLNPCGMCAHCRSRVHVNGNRNWENYLSILTEDEVKTPISLHVSVVNSPDLDADKLDELLDYICRDDSYLKIVYMDEILRLDYKLAAKLLMPMEQYDAIWIASSAYLPRQKSTHTKAPSNTEVEKSQILKMFEGRFTYREETEFPGKGEMFEWLFRRCQKYEIKCEDPRTTLARLVERSQQVPGLALQVLCRADNTPNRTLTYKMVDDHFEY